MDLCFCIKSMQKLAHSLRKWLHHHEQLYFSFWHHSAIAPPNHQSAAVYIRHGVGLPRHCFPRVCWHASKQRRLKPNGSWVPVTFLGRCTSGYGVDFSVGSQVWNCINWHQECEFKMFSLKQKVICIYVYVNVKPVVCAELWKKKFAFGSTNIFNIQQTYPVWYHKTTDNKGWGFSTKQGLHNWQTTP